jgi:hypothetical protein
MDAPLMLKPDVVITAPLMLWIRPASTVIETCAVVVPWLNLIELLPIKDWGAACDCSIRVSELSEVSEAALSAE